MADEPNGTNTNTNVPVEPTEPTEPTEPVVTKPTEPTEPVVTKPTEPEPAKPVDDPLKVDPTPEIKPEDYKLPEGFPEDIRKMAADRKMSQEQLEGTINYFSKYAEKYNADALKQLQDAGKEYVESWGDKQDANLASAKQAVDHYDGLMEKRFVKWLKTSGNNNHPVMIEFLYHVSKTLQEGSFIPSAVHRPPGKKSLAETMFPNHPKH